MLYDVLDTDNNTVPIVLTIVLMLFITSTVQQLFIPVELFQQLTTCYSTAGNHHTFVFENPHCKSVRACETTLYSAHCSLHTTNWRYVCSMSVNIRRYTVQCTVYNVILGGMQYNVSYLGPNGTKSAALICSEEYCAVCAFVQFIGHILLHFSINR